MKNLIAIFKSTWLFIFSSILYFSASGIQNGFFPDFFNVSHSSPDTFFSLILGTTSSILGILVTVILLSYQLLKKLSVRRRQENIIYNWKVTSFISLSTFLIIFSIISWLSVNEFTSSASLTKGYFILILFIAFILLLFPLSIYVLNEVDNLKKTLPLISSLSIANFSELTHSYYTEGNFSMQEVNKPLFIIRQDILIAVKEGDNVDLSIMLAALNEKAIDLIGIGNNRLEVNHILDGLATVWKFSHGEALRTNNYQYFDLIWQCITQLYENAAEKNIKLLHYQNLSMYIWEYINFLTRNKSVDGLAGGVEGLSKSFKENLVKNSPKQENISDLYRWFSQDEIPYNQEDNMQWDYIMDILNNLVKIHVSALSIPDQYLFESSLRNLYLIFHETVTQQYQNVEEYKEAHISIELTMNLLHCASKALTEGMFKNTLDVYEFEGYHIAHIIQNEKFYAKRILSMLSDFLINCQRAEKLDHLDTLNKWGAIPRHTGPYFLKSKTVKESTIFIFNTLKRIKEEIEHNQWPNQYKNYREIKNQIVALHRSLVEDGVPESELQNIVQVELSFKEDKVSPESFIIPWDIQKDIPLDHSA